MTKDKWLDTKETIRNKFDISEDTTEDFGPDMAGQKDIIVFDGPMGKMKLEFTEKPRMIGEKTIFSNRIGSNTKIEKVYDNEDMVSFMNVYRWNPIEEDWTEVKVDNEMVF
jgi:hypothetical protein